MNQYDMLEAAFRSDAKIARLAERCVKMEGNGDV